MSFHKKIPSISLFHTKSSSDDDDDSSKSRSRSRKRSLSPFAFKKRRDSSAEPLHRDAGQEESDGEDLTPVVVPRNAFDSETSDSDEDDHDDDEDGTDVGTIDEQLEANTEANASERTPWEFLDAEGPMMTYPGEGPNLLVPASDLPPGLSAAPTSIIRRRPTKSEKTPPLLLNTGRPVFEKNRCKVTLVHGDPEAIVKEGRRTRTYLVASDLSEESLYAIQWAIGTVLRDGDECWIISVMETDSKFDPDENGHGGDKRNKIANQKERQINASMISRQATTLLERTRLNVWVHCQAIHAKNARHMLVDMIDFFEPTMVIIGTRGLSKIKGMLLGSVSNYLIQKSSSPVMVTRRPLRLARTVHKKLSTLSRESRVTLSEAAIEKESHGGEIQNDPAEPDDIKEQVQKLEISKK